MMRLNGNKGGSQGDVWMSGKACSRQRKEPLPRPRGSNILALKTGQCVSEAVSLINGRRGKTDENFNKGIKPIKKNQSEI